MFINESFQCLLWNALNQHVFCVDAEMNTLVTYVRGQRPCFGGVGLNLFSDFNRSSDFNRQDTATAYDVLYDLPL